MLEWLLSLPRKLFVTLVLAGAVLFIVLQDPPHTVCRTEINNFKFAQSGILYKDDRDRQLKTPPLMEVLIKDCKKYNNPGSCYTLFAKVKHFLKDFRKISPECYKYALALARIKKTLLEIYDLLIRIAWGDAPPTQYHNKLSWLGVADVQFFCTLKAHIIDLYGKEQLRLKELSVLKKLPGAANLSENSIRELSIVSEKCVF